MTFEYSILELRPAMQWWQNHLMESSSEQAETIRNGPLQEVHALQRQLELLELNVLGPNLSTSFPLEPWLHEFQVLYRKLEDISDQLSPPQLTDLSLAIQQRLTLWQAKYPNLPIHFDCPVVVKDSALNRIILLATDAFIQVISDYSQERLALQLQSVGAMGQLSMVVQLDDNYLDLPASFYQELTYLKIGFAYLSGGDCQQEIITLNNVRNLTCFFRWPISSDRPLQF